MKKNICLFFVALLLFACNAKKESTPVNRETILNHEQMKNVLTDIYLIEAALVNSIQDTTLLKQNTTHYYNYLYKKHSISRQQFLKSMEYYCFHTKELSQIYIEVINQLAARQSTPLKE